jgi:hypothetical protein
MRATDGTGTNGHTTPQHIFVTTSAGRFPGLLLEWVRDGDAPWKGRVIWSEREGSHVQDVLDAKQLEPFEPPPGFIPRR